MSALGAGPPRADLLNQLRERLLHSCQALLELGDAELVADSANPAAFQLPHAYERNDSQDGHNHDEEEGERD